MSEYNVLKSRTAQEEYCKENGLPHFAPVSGRCWNCNKNIYEARQVVQAQGTEYEREFTTGITVKKAGSELITGCPHCNRTFCD